MKTFLFVFAVFALVAVSPAQNSSSKQGALKTAASGNSSADSSRVVMKVGNQSITEAEFDSLFETVEKGPKGEEGSAPQSRKSLGESYASALMLSQQAIALHLESTPEVKQQLAMTRIQVLSDAAYAKLEREATPTPQEISQYYSSHLADYDQVDIRRVFVWKQKANSKDGRGLSSEEARARANAIRQAYASGGDAKQLVAGSKDILDAEPLTFERGELPPYMAQAFDMKVGEWSEVADTPDALILFQVVKHHRRDLQQVSPLIEKKLQAQKVRAALEALKHNSNVWMDEEYFGAGAASAATNHKPATPSQ